MRARLVGRDVVMVKSPSPSSRTDDGRGDASLASLEDGREVIGVGDCLRSCALGILPAGSLASQRPMTLTARAAELNIVQAEMTGSPFSSFLPIQHDDRGDAPPLRRGLLGCSERAEPMASVLPLLHLVHGKKPVCLRPQARTGRPRAKQWPRQMTGRLQNGPGECPGDYPDGFRSGVAVSSGNRVSGCRVSRNGAAGGRRCNARARTRLDGEI